MEAKKHVNWFVRVLIAALCLLLSGLITYRFFAIEPRGQIDGGTLAVLGLLIVLTLAESFDNFSVGQLILISREAAKKEREVDKLEKQNSHLLTQIIGMSNAQAQAQSNTTVLGDYILPRVREATPQEVQEKERAEAPGGNPEELPQAAEAPRQRLNPRRVEDLAIQKYAELKRTDGANIIRNATFAAQFHKVDPISDIQPVFDGYLVSSDGEAFIEVRNSDFAPFSFRQQLYVLLSKIYYYRQMKGASAHLDLIIVNIPGRERRMGPPLERYIAEFQPAIASGLLRLVNIEIAEQQLPGLLDP